MEFFLDVVLPYFIVPYGAAVKNTESLRNHDWCLIRTLHSHPSPLTENPSPVFFEKKQESNLIRYILFSDISKVFSMIFHCGYDMRGKYDGKRHTGFDEK